MATIAGVFDLDVGLNIGWDFVLCLQYLHGLMEERLDGAFHEQRVPEVKLDSSPLC